MKTRAKRTKAVAGKKGGTVRAERMTAEERSVSARRAAQARWWTAKQEVLRRYPKAFCFQLQDIDHNAYQVTTPIGDGGFEPLTGVWSSPRLAWENAWAYLQDIQNQKENKGQ